MYTVIWGRDDRREVVYVGGHNDTRLECVWVSLGYGVLDVSIVTCWLYWRDEHVGVETLAFPCRTPMLSNKLEGKVRVGWKRWESGPYVGEGVGSWGGYLTLGRCQREVVSSRRKRRSVIRSTAYNLSTWGRTALTRSGRWDWFMWARNGGTRHWLDRGDGIDSWGRAKWQSNMVTEFKWRNHVSSCLALR